MLIVKDTDQIRSRYTFSQHIEQEHSAMAKEGQLCPGGRE
jgi:hypothetical protein